VLDSRTLQVGATAWAMVGFGIAALGLAGVDADSRIVVGVASVVFPMGAVVAGMAAARGRARAAGALLLLSVATPTYFLWAVNLPALVAGLVLLAGPRRLMVDPR
jgi:hypothetical protein